MPDFQNVLKDLVGGAFLAHNDEGFGFVWQLHLFYGARGVHGRPYDQNDDIDHHQHAKGSKHGLARDLDALAPLGFLHDAIYSGHFH